MTERFAVLSHHFEPVYSNGVWIVPCPDVDIKIALATQQNMDQLIHSMNGIHSNGIGRRVEELGDLDGRRILVAAPGAEVGTIENPIKSKSPTSQGEYLLWKEIDLGKEKVLVALQWLTLFVATSHHTHGTSSEIFRRLYGKLYNYHNYDVIRVENLLYTRPGDSHLSFTIDQSALTLLIQRGQDIKHDYLPRPDYEFLRREAELLDKRLGY